MNAHSLFKSMPAELSRLVVQYFQDKDRAVYRTALETMCQIRKLRPLFIQKKPKPEQLEWIRQALAQTAMEEVAVQLLQIWLLKDRQPMLVAFLDELGVSHDGKGAVESMPEKLDEARISSGVEKLLSSHSGPEVAVYLHMFQQQQPGGWSEVARLLETDARLALSG